VEHSAVFMDPQISQSEQWFRFLAWLEDNWRRVAAVGSLVIGIGVVVAFVLWQSGEKQRRASEALSELLVTSQGTNGTALLDFADAHAGTGAGTRALLMAAGALFAEGQYEQAQSQFQQYLAGVPAGPLTPQARFGVAACKEARGQVDEAIHDYKSIVENPASGNVIPQARFALANLYLRQGQTDLARTQFEELAQVQGSSLAAEARARLAELPPSLSGSPAKMQAVTSPITVTNQP